MSYLSDLLGAAYHDGMTEDEISTALSTAKVGDAASQLEKLKASLSKANSEAADYKKQLRAKQTDDEAAAAARKDEHEKLIAANTELSAKIAKMEQVTKLRGIGYDEKLADATADAMLKGDFDTVMANQTKFLETREKENKAQQMRTTPRPAAGAAEGGADYGKLYAAAQANGDYAGMAYYTRLAAQENAQASQ